MRVLVFATIRGGLAIGAVLFGLAALIGASAGPPERSLTLNRFAVAELNEEDMEPKGKGPSASEAKTSQPLRLMDLRTGEETVWKLPPLQRGDCFSVAPWIEGERSGLAVARWRRISGAGSSRCIEQCGIGLFSVPDGALLKSAETDVLPIAPPAWAPGMEAKVIFPAGDGKLYSLNFDDPDPRPTEFPIISDVAIARIQEISSPQVPSMDNYLLASVVTRDETGDYVGPQLWWMRINSRNDAISAAGPLRPSSEGAANPNSVERWPTAFLGPDGNAAVAYLEGENGDNRYSLRMAPLGFATDGDSPTRSGGLGLRRLARPGPVIADCLADTAPIFSVDGGWFLASQGSFQRRKLVRHQCLSSFASRQ